MQVVSESRQDLLSVRIMMRTIGVKYLDVPELSHLENILRRCNEKYSDRQVRVKLEAYCSKLKAPVRKLEKEPGPLLAIDLDLVELQGKMGSDEEKDAAGIGTHWPDSTRSKRSRGESLSIDVEAKLSFDDALLRVPKKVKAEPSTERRLPQGGLVKTWKGKHPKKNLFKNLVLTLNQVFIDYDFNSIKLEQFQRRSLSEVMTTVSSYILEMSCGEDSVTKVCDKQLWEDIKRVVGVEVSVFDPSTQRFSDSQPSFDGVQIYSYVPETEAEIDADPLAGLGNLWAFNFFFCNPSAGKVVFFACSCRQRKFSQSGELFEDLLTQNSFAENWDQLEGEVGDGEEFGERFSGTGLAVAF